MEILLVRYFVFNLLLASITTLLCFFFLFHIVFNNFFTIPVVIENAKLKLALAILAGAPMMQMMQLILSHFFQVKQLKIYQNIEKKQYLIETVNHISLDIYLVLQWNCIQPFLKLYHHFLFKVLYEKR